MISTKPLKPIELLWMTLPLTPSWGLAQLVSKQQPCRGPIGAPKAFTNTVFQLLKEMIRKLSSSWASPQLGAKQPNPQLG